MTGQWSESMFFIILALEVMVGIFFLLLLGMLLKSVFGCPRIKADRLDVRETDRLIYEEMEITEADDVKIWFPGAIETTAEKFLGSQNAMSGFMEQSWKWNK